MSPSQDNGASELLRAHDDKSLSSIAGIKRGKKSSGRDACRGMAGCVVGPCAGEEELLYLRAVPLVPLDGLGDVGLHRLVRLLR